MFSFSKLENFLRVINLSNSIMKQFLSFIFFPNLHSQITIGSKGADKDNLEVFLMKMWLSIDSTFRHTFRNVKINQYEETSLHVGR